MNPTVRVSLAGMAISSLLGCSEGSAPDRAVISDSAGVQVITFAEPIFQASTEWSVDSLPAIVVGVREGDSQYELHDVASAVMLPAGEIVVADRGRMELLVFSKDGQFVKSLGSPGEGPGEFASISALQLVPPDTLLVFDSDLQRASILTLNDGILRTVQIRTASYAWPGEIRLADATFVLALAGDEVWNQIRSRGVRPGSTARNQAHFARFSAQGELIDTIASVPGYEEAIIEREGELSTMYAAWGRNVAYAVLPSDQLAVGTQAAGELQVLGPQGAVVKLIRWPTGDLTVTQRHIDEFYDVMFQRVTDPAEREAAINRLGELPLPPTRAAFGEVLADHRGLIWISDAHLPMRSARVWGVVNPNSADVARVTLPNGFELLWAGDRHVVGRTTDELGVQRIEVYGLDRSGRGVQP